MIVAGLVWLHRAWRRSEGRRKSAGASARAVVAWTLVPIWGFWRLRGFLEELWRRNGLTEDVVSVGRWWWFLALHIVARVIASQIRVPGWLHVGDALLQATAALLGAQMVSRIEGAQDAR